MTDRELWQAAWKELTLTTDPYPTWKKKGFPASSHWAKAKSLGDQIGALVPPPPSGGVPALASVGSSGVLANRTGGTLSGVNLTGQRFTTVVSFGPSPVTLTNCEFAGGLDSTYPSHGKLTLSYCTLPAAARTGWYFEENPPGSGNPGGSANVFLDHCVFYGAYNVSEATMQAIRPKGAGTLTATDCWFLSYGEPASAAHTEVIQLLYGASMVATRCAFSRTPVSNNTVTGVLYHESPTDGVGGSFTDCVFGGYNTSTGQWSRGGGYYMVGPGQASFVRPTIYSTAGSPSDAWYAGNPPVSLVDPVYVRGI